MSELGGHPNRNGSHPTPGSAFRPLAGDRMPFLARRAQGNRESQELADPEVTSRSAFPWFPCALRLLAWWRARKPTPLPQSAAGGQGVGPPTRRARKSPDGDRALPTAFERLAAG